MHPILTTQSREENCQANYTALDRAGAKRGQNQTIHGKDKTECIPKNPSPNKGGKKG